MGFEPDLSAVRRPLKSDAERAEGLVYRAWDLADKRSAWLIEQSKRAAELCAELCFQKLNQGRATDLWSEDPKVSPIANLINTLAKLPAEEPKIAHPKGQIAKWTGALDKKLWRAFELDQLQALMVLGETITEVGWWMITTSRASYSREELRGARPGSWRYIEGWQKNFASEAEIARAIEDEAKHRAQEEKIDNGTRAFASPDGIASPAGAGLPEEV